MCSVQRKEPETLETAAEVQLFIIRLKADEKEVFLAVEKTLRPL